MSLSPAWRSGSGQFAHGYVQEIRTLQVIVSKRTACCWRAIPITRSSFQSATRAGSNVRKFQAKMSRLQDMSRVARHMNVVSFLT